MRGRLMTAHRPNAFDRKVFEMLRDSLKIIHDAGGLMARPISVEELAELFETTPEKMKRSLRRLHRAGVMVPVFDDKPPGPYELLIC